MIQPDLFIVLKCIREKYIHRVLPLFFTMSNVVTNRVRQLCSGGVFRAHQLNSIQRDANTGDILKWIKVSCYTNKHNLEASDSRRFRMSTS